MNHCLHQKHTVLICICNTQSPPSSTSETNNACVQVFCTAPLFVYYTSNTTHSSYTNNTVLKTQHTVLTPTTQDSPYTNTTQSLHPQHSPYIHNTVLTPTTQSLHSNTTQSPYTHNPVLTSTTQPLHQQNSTLLTPTT